jgi:predicted transcriptional regulator YheO
MPPQPPLCLTSDWISFLRQYGPIPRNDNMYDEVIQRSLKRKKIQPITFETEYLGELLENFRSASPKSIILTGTAGDGKTYYCRKIWEAFGGSKEDWQKGNKIHQLVLGDRHLVVIKDLSELSSEEKRSLLPQVASAITGADTTTVYLIAANDGQLVEAWVEAAQTAEIEAVRQTIEDLLVNDLREADGYQVKLYNLSRQSAAVLFPRILDAILSHPGWGDCNQCAYQSQGCPIWQNKQRLEGAEDDKTTRERLTDLLSLCELNQIHLPVRQLLLLVANTLLGHPEAKDRLLNCRQIPDIISAGTTSSASLYRNIFGENLPERRRESTEVFKVLRGFGIGAETSNQIDNILIFGADDPELQALYADLVLSDSFYGADLKYQAQQYAYLEGDAARGQEEFLTVLQTQRQRLFFTIPSDRKDMQLWDLTVFHYAGEYLNKLYRALQDSRKVPKSISSRLVRGLNRIFTGLLVSNQDELILATSGSYSQARISRVYEESISVTRKRGESVSIELDKSRKKPILVVCLASDVTPISFNLTLTRYEYLSRVAEGALPSSFSQECYEDVLAFKTQVFKQLAVRQSLEGETDGEEMSIRLLEVNSAGIASERSLEVYF